MKSLQHILFFSILITALFTGSWLSAAEAPLWLRYPAISPDGSTVVFAYGGDLYRVPTKGGEAQILTLHTDHDFMPVWSPDGQWIAFASARYGNFDVFVMPATGGTAQRLTYHAADDFPMDFTPDGRAIIFRSVRLDDPKSTQFPTGAFPEVYQVDLTGGQPAQLLTTPAIDARFSRDGQILLYHDQKGYEDDWRKHHTSSVARDIWRCDLATNTHTRLTDFAGEDRNPVFSPDESQVFYLSEESGSFNVWVMSADDPGQHKPITFHETHPVRFLSMAADGTLCYSYHGEIYIVPSDAAKSRKLRVSIAKDDRFNTAEYRVFSDKATEMKLSPNGKEMALIVRGDVFVTSIDGGVTKQVTATPGEERWVRFNSNGRALVYASERQGSWNIYESSLSHEKEKYFFLSTIITEKPIIETPVDTYQPNYAPDDTEIAYLENRTTLKVINLKSKESRLILPGDMNYSYSDGDQWYQWSPDGKWFLVNFLDTHRWSGEVGLVAASGQDSVINLTNSGYEDEHPQWVLDGQAMMWFSDRHGLRAHASWGGQYDTYLMAFNQETYDRFILPVEEFELLKEAEEKDEEKEKDSKKKTEKKEVKPSRIDLNYLEDRTLRLSRHSADLAEAVLTPDGENLLYLAKFEKNYDLWSYQHREKEIKLLAKLNLEEPEFMEVDQKGEHVFILADGSPVKVKIEGGEQEPIEFSAAMQLNLAEERAYMFDHVCRQINERFYVPELHAVDWSFYTAAYKTFLPHINNNWDFAEMLSELLGELNASHTGSGYRFRRDNGDDTAALGAFFGVPEQGSGLEIIEIMEKSPLLTAASQIQAGMIIEQIDGRTITTDNYFPLLNHKAGQYTLLKIFDPATNKRWDEKVKLITRGAEQELLYQRWVKSRREETERLSGGKLGYVHVRSMDDDSFRETFAEVLGRHSGKEALIVDTRFNGGGWLAEDLCTFLSGEKYASSVARGQVLGEDPWNKWNRPSIVLMSEGNYSEAHYFPWVYQELKIGDLVGMPVPGTATSVLWETLQDESMYFGVPQVGVQDNRGNYLENRQLEPDHKIDNDPASVSRGRDLQLEKAIEILLKK